MKAAGRIGGATFSGRENATTVILNVFGDHAKELKLLSSKVCDIEIRLHRDKRSTRANALCWELCSQIGKAIMPPVPKEEIYRSAIRAVGEFEQYYIREEAVQAFMDTRKLLGIGWFADIAGDAPLRGWVEVFAYKGSSAYDTKQMATLIDYLIDEAEQMDLPIGYDLKEIERIKNDWAAYSTKD